LLQYNFQQIREATNNFHGEHKLGEGGFGPVFKVLKLNSLLIFYCCYFERDVIRLIFVS